MDSDIPSINATPAKDTRSRNKLVLTLTGVIFGIVWSKVAKFLAAYDGPWEIRLALVLVPLALVGVMAVFSRRFYQADELEILINRQALGFAFYAALSGLAVLHLLQSGGFVPVFVWTTKQLIFGLVLLMTAGILWSKRRYS
jgi:hypothetical protein